MPYTLKKNKFKYKNPDTGNYEGVDVVAERSFADYQSALETVGLQQQTVVRSEGTTQKNAVTAAGTAAVANFPATAAACDTLAGDFAATYVPDQAYAVGDYCTYQYQLYQCKTAIAVNTDHTFVTSHWNLITVTDTINDQVDDLKTQLSDIGVEEKTSPNLLDPSDIEAGRITSSSSTVLHTGTYDDDYKTTGFMPVTAGEKYGFHATNNGKIIGIAISNIWAYDSSKAALSGGYLGGISYNSDGLSYITVPTGCAYIRASALSEIFTDHGIVMFSKVDGVHKPETIQAYGSTYVLEGYVNEEEFEAVKDIVDDNFIPDYSPIEGTETTGKYIKSTGNVESIDDSNYVIIEVSATPGTTYKVSARGYQLSYYYAFYDSNGNFLSGLQAPSGSGTASIFDSLTTAPANAAKLIAEGKSDIKPVIEGVSGYIPKESKPWSGKKWVCVGDSLTEANVATTKHYFEYIADRTGIGTVNMGVGGTGYVRGYDVDKAFYQRIADVPTDADIVTVFGSGNDKNISAMSIFDGKTWEQALGDYTDTGTETICGCVNTCLDNYFAVMPVVPIGIIAPTPWMNYPTTLTTGNRMADYTEKLRKIAEYRGVPFLDLYHHSNLRPEDEDNRDACFYDGDPLDRNGDGVHPNALGHKIIAPKIYEFVKTLLLS